LLGRAPTAATTQVHQCIQCKHGIMASNGVINVINKVLVPKS
jgi:uncharacterized surface protein with fasciclin (FAS1) repeats